MALGIYLLAFQRKQVRVLEFSSFPMEKPSTANGQSISVVPHQMGLALTYVKMALSILKSWIDWDASSLKLNFFPNCTSEMVLELTVNYKHQLQTQTLNIIPHGR